MKQRSPSSLVYRVFQQLGPIQYHSNFVQSQGAEVSVETDSPLSLGQTIVNPRRSVALAHPVQVADTVDAVGIYQLLQDRLAILP